MTGAPTPVERRASAIARCDPGQQYEAGRWGGSKSPGPRNGMQVFYCKFPISFLSAPPGAPPRALTLAVPPDREKLRERVYS